MSSFYHTHKVPHPSSCHVMLRCCTQKQTSSTCGIVPLELKTIEPNLREQSNTDAFHKCNRYRNVKQRQRFLLRLQFKAKRATHFHHKPSIDRVRRACCLDSFYTDLLPCRIPIGDVHIAPGSRQPPAAWSAWSVSELLGAPSCC